MLHVNALGTWTVTDLPRAPRVMRGNARGGTLEYEHVGPALLHFEQVDFLDDVVGARAASPAILAISAAPSGQSRVGGNGGEGVGGQGEMVDVGGNRKQDKTSLFAGVQDDKRRCQASLRVWRTIVGMYLIIYK